MEQKIEKMNEIQTNSKKLKKIHSQIKTWF